MSEFTRALNDYVVSELFINESESTLKQLEAEYENIQAQYPYTSLGISEAEEIIEAAKRIQKHHSTLADKKETLTKAETIIKKNLEVLKGKGVAYVAQLQGYVQYPKYHFTLQDGEVTHNRKNNPDG